MTNRIISTTETTAIVPEIWSAKFFDVLLDRLPFNSLINNDWEGEIQSLGDIVNISSIPEFSDAELLEEGAAGDSDAVTITSQPLTINKRPYKDYIITKKAQLQSLSFMDGIRDKAIFAIMKKMQAIIIETISPSTSSPDHTIAWDSGTQLQLADVLEAKELLDTANVPEDGRSSVHSAIQMNDFFNITGFISKDFIPAGSPLAEGAITTKVCGFDPKMTNVVGNTSYFFHKSFMTLAIQDQLSIEVFNMGVDGVRGFRTNIDLLMGIKQMDSSRIVSIS